jgi:hypothetical protein
MKQFLVVAITLFGAFGQAHAEKSVGLAPACKAAAQNIPKICGAFDGRKTGMSLTQAACFQREAAKAQSTCGMRNGRIVDRQKFGVTQAPDLNYKSDRHH